jgi:hypothetical protein
MVHVRIFATMLDLYIFVYRQCGRSLAVSPVEYRATSGKAGRVQV